MGYPRAPLPEDFREKWEELKYDTALLRHYGGGIEKIERWRKEAGLARQIRAKPAPRGLRKAWALGLTDKELGARFGVGESVAGRWREQAGLRRNVHGKTCKLPPLTYYTGCRCPKCREDNRRLNARRQAERVQLTLENGGIAPVPVHNANTYGNWGCRCDECSADKSRANAAQALRRKMGTPSTKAAAGHWQLAHS